MSALLTSLSLLAFVGLQLVIWARAVHLYRSERVLGSVVSVVSSIIYASALVAPAYLQAAGALRSKLAVAGFLPPPTFAEVNGLMVRWTGELLLILVAEVIISTLASGKVGGRRTEWHADRARQIAIILLAIGLFGFALFPPNALADRGQGGEGIGILLRGCLISAIVVAVWYRHFGSKYWVAISLAVIVLSLSSAVRSPLFLIIFAYAARELFGRNRRAVRVVILFIIGAILAAILSNARATITRDGYFNAAETVTAVYDDPLLSVLEAGVDTLDGYRLSDAVLQIEPARPSDLIRVVSTFVPRSVWPDKPDGISVEYSSKYLGWNVSGIFLSPTGYLSLVAGSYAGGLALLFLVSAAFSWVLQRAGGTVWTVFVAYMIFRFYLDGNAFDIYYVLVYLLPVWLVTYSTWNRERSHGHDVIAIEVKR